MLPKISNDGFKRMSQVLEPSTNLEYIRSILDNPDGWFFHAASKPLLSRNTGYATLFVEAVNYDDATHYGSYYNFIKPDSVVDVDSISEEVVTTLWSDYDAGILEPALENLVSSAMRDSEDAMSSILEELNPDNIVDTAGMWDSPEFVRWFADRFNYGFIKTYGGGVAPVVDEGLGEVVTITKSEFEQLWD